MPKVSYSSIASDWKPAIQDLYTVSFQDTSLNVLPAGLESSSGGNVFPATSVQEHIFSVDNEEIQLVSGIRVPFPVHVETYGTIDMTFTDSNKYAVTQYFHKLLTEKMYSQDSSTLKQMSGWVQELTICRYDNWGKVTNTSKYGVLIPTSMMVNNSNALAVSEAPVNLKIVKVYNKIS